MAKNPRGAGLPATDDYYIAVVHSLRNRPNLTATNEQIEHDVARQLDISEAALAIPHRDGRRTKFEYDLAWVRTYLKWGKFLDNITSGVWQLTTDGREASDRELIRVRKDVAAAQRAKRARSVPRLPKQGPGPHFTLRRGVLSFAPQIDASGNDLSRLRALKPVMLDTVDDLLRALSKHEGLWPELERAAKTYRGLLADDISEIDYGRLFGQGLILSNSLRAAKTNSGGNIYPLATEPTVLAESLLDLHGPFILGTRDGQSLVSDAERYEANISEIRKAREAEIQLSRLIAAPNGPSSAEVKSHVREVIDAEVVPTREDRQNIYRGAMVRNAAIVMVGGTVISTIAATAVVGGAIPATIVTAAIGIFGKKALENSIIGKEVGSRLTNIVDQVTIDFILDNETLLRSIAGRRHMSWLNKALDWTKQQRSGLVTLTEMMASAIDGEAMAEAWQRYRSGEKNAFSRRIYTTVGQATYDDVRKRIQRDTDFAKTAATYMAEFEQLLKRASERDVEAQSSVDETSEYLLSDRGRVYTILAHAAGRLGQGD